MPRISLFFILLLLFSKVGARQLQPGFDGNEFRKMFQISAHCSDTQYWKKIKIPMPANYNMVYRSTEKGLDNRWDLWLGADSVAVISIRGTTGTTESWLENLYAGMVPATGVLNMGNDTLFHYKLAEDSLAYVHIGWTIGLGYIAPEVVQQINAQYKNGVRYFVIMGHSQGGAIGFLLYSYLHYEMGKSVPADIRLKVYGSGVPKVGNQKFAYDFDFIAREGWAYRVVNSIDWVPEVPFAIQTLNDLSSGNPFGEYDERVHLKWPASWIGGHLIKKMNRQAKRAERRFRKFLGTRAGKLVRKQIPGMPKQEYVKSMAYATSGNPIVLVPDAHYYELYPDKGEIFTNHYYGPYYYLLNVYYPVK